MHAGIQWTNMLFRISLRIDISPRWCIDLFLDDLVPDQHILFHLLGTLYRLLQHSALPLHDLRFLASLVFLTFVPFWLSDLFGSIILICLGDFKCLNCFWRSCDLMALSCQHYHTSHRALLDELCFGPATHALEIAQKIHGTTLWSSTPVHAGMWVSELEFWSLTPPAWYPF